jgi:hypothetical protein
LGDELLGDAQKGSPPRVRVLLGPAVGKQQSLDRLELPARDLAGDRNQRGLAARGAEIDGEDVLVARCSQADPRYSAEPK